MSDQFPEEIEKILREHAPDPILKDNDLTVKRAAEHWQVTGRHAQNKLDALVAKGVFRKVMKRDAANRPVGVYEVV